MRIAFALPVSGTWATPDNVLHVARQAEAAGYHGLWTFQRLLAPADHSIEPWYTSVLDPAVVLGFAAAVTERAELGVAIINAPFESPALLAKQMASLDVLSRGRLVTGIGAGWLKGEFTASGVPFERRGARIEEYVHCVRAIWGPDPVTFDGEFYQLPPSLMLPKPTFRPGGATPPILMGGTAPAALERIGRIGDGWISSSRVTPADLANAVTVVRQSATEAGRDPDRLRFVCRAVVRDEPRTGPLTGPLELVRDDLAGLAEYGITDAFVDLNFDRTIGVVDADPKASMQRADDVLTALAPGALSDVR
jgi:probable F420-dependent oxidoreductase